MLKPGLERGRGFPSPPRARPALERWLNQNHDAGDRALECRGIHGGLVLFDIIGRDVDIADPGRRAGCKRRAEVSRCLARHEKARVVDPEFEGCQLRVVEVGQPHHLLALRVVRVEVSIKANVTAVLETEHVAFPIVPQLGHFDLVGGDPVDGPGANAHDAIVADSHLSFVANALGHFYPSKNSPRKLFFFE